MPMSKLNNILKLHFPPYKNTVSLYKETSVNRPMIRETILAYVKEHVKTINKFCGELQGILMLGQVVNVACSAIKNVKDLSL